uniref:WD repeat-containing protein 55 homolog n=1 Tax=Glossina brevipalpis TaxID=37001 RepID=A0A1A9W532_9MUSC
MSLNRQHNFKNPDDRSDLDYFYDELIDEVEEMENDEGLWEYYDVIYLQGASDSEDDTNNRDANFQLDDDTENSSGMQTVISDDDGTESYGGCLEDGIGNVADITKSVKTSVFEWKGVDEYDETVSAIIAAIKKPRSSPPDIKLEDFVADICFHPERDIIAVGTISHAKACRDIQFTEDGCYLLTCSEDKSIMVADVEIEKLYVQSEPYEEKLICIGIYRGNSKLVGDSSKGNLYTFNWGQFGYHSDKFPGVNAAMSEMTPVTDRIAGVSREEGIIKAVHVAPFRNLGIVGQHTMSIESLDISNNGELIASSLHNNGVRFWNIKYFEDFGDIKNNEKHNAYKEKNYDLQSSKFNNASDIFPM